MDLLPFESADWVFYSVEFHHGFWADGAGAGID